MQRHAKAYEYFSDERFTKASDPKDITDEIALNLAHLEAATAKPAMQVPHVWGLCTVECR